MRLQTRNNPFIAMAGLYLVVGAIALLGKILGEAGGVTTVPRIRWTAIHFVTIGAVTQALFGVLPAFLAGTTPPTATGDQTARWLQWLSLNAGFPFILLGMVTGRTVTASVGAVLVLVALGGLIRTVYGLESDSDSTRYFRTALWYLVVGILAALGMLLNVHGPGGYFGSIEAHVHANAWGFIAITVAGVLLGVLPRLFEADLAYPRLRAPVYWGLTVGAAGLVAGPWLALDAVTVAGLGAYVVGTATLLATVIGTYRRSDRSQQKRLALVLGAYLWLLFPVPWAPLILLYPETVPGAAIELAAIDGLVFGWMLQLAVAFLPLVATASKTDIQALPEAIGATSRTVREPTWLQIGSLNAGVGVLWLAAIPRLAPVATELTVGGYLLIAVGWVLFLADFWAALILSDDRPATPGSPPEGRRG
ncbi:MAG: hypothetical protein ABEK02_01800 [Haloquadratum sp.]